jgi:hypothetical protein
VSKPFAQAVDRIETYAVIVILLVIKGIATLQDDGPPQVALVQLGILSFTVDTLLGLAMVANILVINSVKFFFEFMIWLTPIPLVDAIFEVCNKTLCAALMMVYAVSPTIATVINLVILVAAAIVLRWISRRVRFYRTMVLDPILAKLWSGFGRSKRPELIVFPKSSLGPFAAKSRLKLSRATDEASGWVLEEANWWMPSKQHRIAPQALPKVRCGWVLNTIEIRADNGDSMVLSFSRRYDDHTLQQVLEQLRLERESAGEFAQNKLDYEFA